MPLQIKSKFWIEDEMGRPVFGQGRRIILEKIDELGSIRAAAAALKMSYRAVWGKIKSAEERLGIKLVETTPGGGKSRGARLTPEARDFLRMFQQLHDRGNTQADRLFKKVFKT
ncbi:MAG: LysR family transcriptional regulator [Deltaproteobacteria bacterium]|nr:LysR family transcriptional regulator [Deltaproteobacteria bacterium]MBW2084802.1 LysR family transcriptional regulator [Deltaproteobacteria bacterium]